MIFELPDCSFTKLKKHATFVLCKRRIGVFGLGEVDGMNFSFLFPKEKVYGGVLCGSFSPAPSMEYLLYVEGIRP